MQTVAPLKVRFGLFAHPAAAAAAAVARGWPMKRCEQPTSGDGGGGGDGDGGADVRAAARRGAIISSSSLSPSAAARAQPPLSRAQLAAPFALARFCVMSGRQVVACSTAGDHGV